MSSYKQFITNYYERTNTFATRFFKEIDVLPEIGDLYEGKRVLSVTPMSMDCEQPTDDHHNYELYELKCKYDDEDEMSTETVCIREEIEL